MKVIHKKISLEPYRSRINGSLNSYNGEIEETFPNYDKRSKIHNYGMFPYDVIYNGNVLSYPTLMYRYYFCKRYNEMLKYDACVNDGKYENAIDYYKHNVIEKNDENKRMYQDMDDAYNEYGGNEFFEWCNSILYGGNVTYSTYDNTELNSEYGNTAHINIPIIFTNTIDDMGEFSIFSNEWEEGEDYRNTIGSGGTTVLYDDEVWRFNSNGDNYGSIYSNKYKELYFANISELPSNVDYKWYEKSNGDIEYSENQWVNNTVEYFNSSNNDYSEKPKDKNSTYATKLGKVLFSPTPEDMSYPYEIIKNGDLGFYLIDDFLYDTFETEWVEYIDGTPLIVYTIDNPNINEKYCTYNELKFYSKTDEDNPSSHYFEFEEGKKTYVNDKDKFIQYQETIYQVNNDKIIIDNGEVKIAYNKIDGYVMIEGVKYYIKNNNVVTPKRIDISYADIEYDWSEEVATKFGKELSGNLNSTSSGYTCSDNILKVYKPYVEYDINTISGYTESKLNSFITYNTASDDIGNVLPGCLKFDGEKYEQPKENDILELPYRVGNINNLTAIEYDDEGNATKWFGNILTSITFFYEDYYGNEIEDTEVKCEYNQSLLSGITNCSEKLKTFKESNNSSDIIAKNHNNINDTMKCKFIYHMGAIIDIDGEKYKVSTDEHEQGVVYEETVSIMKKQFMYYYDEFSSFPLYYYDFEYDKKYIKLNEYSNNTIEINQSKFKVAIDDLIENTSESTRASYDGMIMAPVFREEYKFGVSMMENVESDIYIDRGVSNAFERHLNLLNVNSMESLEQFR